MWQELDNGDGYIQEGGEVEKEGEPKSKGKSNEKEVP